MTSFCFMPRDSSAGKRALLPGQLQLREEGRARAPPRPPRRRAAR